MVKNKFPFYKIIWLVPLILIVGLIVFWIDQVRADRNSIIWPSQGWDNIAPETVGVDSKGLVGMVDSLQGKNVHSFVLVRDGRIIAEGYNADHSVTSKQDVLSVTKSITSALVGIAIDHKLINKVDEPISDFYPVLEQDADTRKQDILLSQILTMTSGISWNNDKDISSIEMTQSSDWTKFVLGLPLASIPGAAFTYNNGAVHLLSAILEKATGKKEAQYAKEALFDPLGIKDFNWQSEPSGHSIGSFGLSLTARDMAKFGYLYLNNGEWDGKQIISKQWVKDSTKPYLNFTDSASNQTEIGYGYLWWLREGSYTGAKKSGVADMYSADGSGGQRIYVMPKLNMVAVFTANNPDPFFADSIIDQFIVPSIKSNKSLAANSEGDARLKAKIQEFSKVKDAG